MTIAPQPHSRPELPAAELRRAGADHARSQAADHQAMRRSVRGLFDGDTPFAVRAQALVGRRRFLQLGGFSVATAAVLSACAGTESDIGRIGDAPPLATLPDAEVNDIVLLRTASSIERSAIAVYDLVLGNSALLDPALTDVAKRFRDDHLGHADIFDALTTEAGGEAWTCGNPRIDELLIAPVVAQIVGDASADILPSDDVRRDVLNFAHGLETLAGETYQALVQAVSTPELRKAAMQVGSQEVRHAALFALAITGRPDGFIPPAEAPADPPPIPVVYAIPAAFGQLAGTQIVVGAPDELGQRRAFNLDTPSLNTFVYEYMDESFCIG
jgi:rubrerythrin